MYGGRVSGTPRQFFFFDLCERGVLIFPPPSYRFLTLFVEKAPLLTLV